MSFLLMFLCGWVSGIAAESTSETCKGKVIGASDDRTHCDPIDSDSTSLLQSRQVHEVLEGEGSSFFPHLPDKDCSCRELNTDATIQYLNTTIPDVVGFTVTILDGCGRIAGKFTRGGFFCYTTDCEYNSSTGWSDDAVYPSHSQSKVVSASVFMASIVDTGLATVDTPLKELLPHIFDPQNAYAEVTPRQIFSHTSGWTSNFWAAGCFQTLPGQGNPDWVNVSNVTLEQCIWNLSKLPPAFPPGTQFEYSDNSFEVIALIVEKLSGMVFEEAFQKYVAKPLGMSNSSYVCMLGGSTYEHSHPADGLCTTAIDYPKVVRMLSLWGRTQTGRRILKKCSVKTIFADQTQNAVLYNNNVGFFQGHSQGTVCVTNTQATNASQFGYGFGAIHSWGFRSPYWSHGGALGSTWVISHGRYAVGLSMSVPPVFAWSSPEAALGVLEAVNFADEVLCPLPTIKLDLPEDPAIPDGIDVMAELPGAVKSRSSPSDWNF